MTAQQEINCSVSSCIIAPVMMMIYTDQLWPWTDRGILVYQRMWTKCFLIYVGHFGLETTYKQTSRSNHANNPQETAHKSESELFFWGGGSKQFVAAASTTNNNKSVEWIEWVPFLIPVAATVHGHGHELSAGTMRGRLTRKTSKSRTSFFFFFFRWRGDMPCDRPTPGTCTQPRWDPPLLNSWCPRRKCFSGNSNAHV